MAPQQFEASKKSGKHNQLNLLAGNWEGNTKTWFEPGNPVDESLWRGVIRPILDGRFMLHEYEGTFQGKPLQGLALYGYDLVQEKYQGAWVDSYHMSTGIMFSEDTIKKDHFSATGTYYAGRAEDGSEIRWGWRTEIEVISTYKIAITAYNIAPDGAEMKATETTYSRRS